MDESKDSLDDRGEPEYEPPTLTPLGALDDLTRGRISPVDLDDST
jgi:hypothetical protein